MDRAVADMLDPGGTVDSERYSASARCIIHVVSVQCIHDLIILLLWF